MNNIYFNRHPLIKNKFAKLPTGWIRPSGWLLHQLELQARGLTGYIEEEWPDVGGNSGWLNGSGENWERGPYYLDGLIPLAYILEDDRLISKSRKWIESILNSQKENGFFGPEDNRDWWPRMVVLKALIQYYEATMDDRVISFMLNYFDYEFKNLDKQPLKMWGEMRGGDNLVSVYWLYNITGEKFLLELSRKIFEQTYDWTGFFRDIPLKKPIKEYLDFDEFMDIGWEELLNPTEISREKANYIYYTYHTSHIVNVAMALKEPAIFYQQDGCADRLNIVKKGYEQLMKYHGTVNGMFTGDEHINGPNPTQGTELCAVVELMYSMEKLIEITGEPLYADILEKITFNALPATFNPEITAHQYLQQVNQVACNVAKRNWYNNNDDSNIFGLEPNFGCCTANLHQGWPKFVQNTWMLSDEGELTCISLAPCTVTVPLENGKLVIDVITDYPFKERAKIKVKCSSEVQIPLSFRIPAWCDKPIVMLNGGAVGKIENGFVKIPKPIKDGDVIDIELPADIKLTRWYRNSIGVERGSLVYALRIGERWNKIVSREYLSDYEVFPTTPWNYGLIANNSKDTFKYEEGNMSYQPFDSNKPPVKVTAYAKKIPEWTVEGNSAGELPESAVTSQEDIESVELIPYGSAHLKIAQFPEIKEE